MDAVSELKARLDEIRPLDAETIAALMPLWEAQIPAYVQATNAIEGNTLTLGETMVVLNEDRVIPNKSVAEHLQAVNGKNAFARMLAMAIDRHPIALEAVVELHALVEATYPHAGRLRRTAVYIVGSLHVPPNFVKVPRLLDEMFERYERSIADEHPVIAAAKLHFDLVTIHPFSDGNGRTSRLVQNLSLIQSGYPPILIRGEDRASYFDVLRRCQVKDPGIGDPTEFIAYCVDLQLRSFERYLPIP